jgi:hypothetical protein
MNSQQSERKLSFLGSRNILFFAMPNACHCLILLGITERLGYAVAQLVEALRYKLEGREFNSRWCHWNFSLT